jgi:hypothetical protein
VPVWAQRGWQSSKLFYVWVKGGAGRPPEKPRAPFKTTTS